jgi:hypothetical protein
LNTTINHLRNASRNLSQVREALESAIFWQILGLFEFENDRINRSLDRMEQAIEELKEHALQGLISAMTGASNATKILLQNNINKLDLMYFRWLSLAAKLWLISEIGPTTHGSEIPIPDDIWICNTGNYYRPVNRSIHVNRARMNYTDVFLHELDHHFMYMKTNFSFPGGNHWIATPLNGTRTGYQNTPPTGPVRNATVASRLAFSEGWATFSSSAKQNDSLYQSSTSWEWDVENNRWRRLPGGAWNNIPGGVDVEGAITAILWDLFDGINLTENDNVTIPFKLIWKAINNHSDPNASRGQPSRNITEFYQHLENLINNDPEFSGLRGKLQDIRRIFGNHGVAVP